MSEDDERFGRNVSATEMEALLMNAEQTAMANDLLTGASAIAKYLGWDRRRIYHAAATGHLPITRVGSLLVARKSELERALSADATQTRQNEEFSNDNNI